MKFWLSALVTIWFVFILIGAVLVHRHAQEPVMVAVVIAGMGGMISGVLLEKIERMKK